MKKCLLFIMLFQLLSLNMWAIDERVLKFEYLDGGKTDEFQKPTTPITGGINDKELSLYYNGNDCISVSVSSKTGSVVYQNQFNTSSRKDVSVDLNNYQEGDYIISVEDPNGNTAVANFQVKKVNR